MVEPFRLIRSSAKTRRAAALAALAFVLFTVASAAVLSIALPASQVRINVRWRPEVTEAQREALERRFHLLDGRPTRASSSTTRRYLLADTSRANIRALVQHPEVDDTAGLNRVKFRLPFAVDRGRQIQFFSVVLGLAGTATLSAAVARRMGIQIPPLGAWAIPPRYVLWFELLAVAVGAFAFRMLTLRDFANDHYMHLAWAQQLLAGAVPGRDFVDPGYFLTYTLSAAAQMLAPGPLSEAVLSSTLMAVAAVAALLATHAMTGSLAAALLAAVGCVLIQPELYNYPKLLAPAVALWLLARDEAKPSKGRLALVAGWTTISFLFRHDLGCYVAAAVLAGLVISNWDAPRTALRRASWYVAIGILTVLPYLAFVQWAQGIPDHVREGLVFFGAESYQLATASPPFPALTTIVSNEWGRHDSVGALFYLIRLAIPCAIVLFLVRRHHHRPGTRAVTTAAIVLLALYAAVILRHPIANRIRDLAVPGSIVIVWICWNVMQTALRPAGRSAFVRFRQVASIAAVVVVALSALRSAWTLTDAGEVLSRTRVLEGRRGVIRQARAVSEWAHGAWPSHFWPVGAMPEVVEYFRICTGPRDRVLTTWPAPEYYVFGWRGFAAGHAWMSGFTSLRDQSLMISRLDGESVPVVLVNRTRHEEFADRYHLLAGYLESRYEPVAEYVTRDDDRIAITVRKDLQAASTFGPDNWPCGLESPRDMRDQL